METRMIRISINSSRARTFGSMTSDENVTTALLGAEIEVVFRRGLTGYSIPHSGSGGDDQGAVRSGQRGAESLDGEAGVVASVRPANLLQPPSFRWSVRRLRRGRRTRRARHVAQAHARAGQGCRKPSIQQALGRSASIHEPAGPLQRRISPSPCLKGHAAAFRFPQSQYPHAIMRSILRQPLPDGGVPKQRCLAESACLGIFVEERRLARAKIRGRKCWFFRDGR
jgi:hypothetical protein